MNPVSVPLCTVKKVELFNQALGTVFVKKYQTRIILYKSTSCVLLLKRHYSISLHTIPWSIPFKVVYADSLQPFCLLFSSLL